MKKHSKNLISSIALLAVLCIGYVTPSFGAPAHNIKYTKHNFGTTSQFGSWKATSESEICVFCHTPHNAAAGKRFLWNKNGYAPTWQMYTASPTLDFSRPAAPSEVSKLCMTCHDGAGAINAMANPRTVIMTGEEQLGDMYLDPLLGYGVDPCTESWCKNIGEAVIDTPGAGYSAPSSGGGVLVNDHPISFIYKNSCDIDSTIKRTGADCSGSSIGGLPLWWSSDNGLSGYKVECVTCHDPHINYVGGTPGGDSAYTPFLRKSNASSNLCFTCHDK